MSTPTDLQRAGLTSIQGAMLICGVSRDTIRKAIAEHNLQPAGQDGAGNPLYRIADIVRAVDARGRVGAKAGGGEVVDPLKLSPGERDAWYRSEDRRIKLEKDAGKLGSVEDFKREHAKLVRIFGQFLDTLPDVMERDAMLTPDQVDVMHDRLEELRQQLYDELVALGASAQATDLSERLAKLAGA